MKRYLLAISAVALPLFVFDAGTQAWPTKPLRAIVPVVAGSSTDIVHRFALEQLSAQLGQPIVVENRVSAGGTIGSAAVAKSEPDGYTILAHGPAHTIAPALYKNLAYHPARDFIAVVAVGRPSFLQWLAPPASARWPDVGLAYRDFQDFWQAQTPNYYPTTKIVASMTESARTRLMRAVRAELPMAPGGVIKYFARANAIKAGVPRSMRGQLL